ncbi:MAG: hypothetical protein KatS3mg108_2411 [Isosphaeraceae bacterium]|nr:MAG: hypothetical protein KatS3mg108_2411 [Isosphaeraceae bacterium]
MGCGRETAVGIPPIFRLFIRPRGGRGPTGDLPRASRDGGAPAVLPLAQESGGDQVGGRALPEHPQAVEHDQYGAPFVAHDAQPERHAQE